MTEQGTASSDLAARIRGEVERALQRGVKGFDYLASHGPRLGATPRDLLAQRGTYALYRYRPIADELCRVPLFIVMAVTNRGYIFDLVPGQSLVEFLLRQGYDVFMVDWSPPRRDEKGLRLDDYALDFLPDAVRRVQLATGERNVNLVGYCMGGCRCCMPRCIPAGRCETSRPSRRRSTSAACRCSPTGPTAVTSTSTASSTPPATRRRS